MKHGLIFMVTALAFTVFEARGALPSLAVGEVTYENVTLKREYPRSLFIKHDGGTAFVDRRALSQEQLSELLAATGEPAAKTGKEEDYEKAKSLLQEEDDGKNWSLAIDLMRRAAEAGYPAAQYQWGVFLIDGFGVAQDGKKGGELLRKSAEAGEGQAMRELAMMEKDPEKMMQGIKRAAEAGDGQAMVYMVAMHAGRLADNQTDYRDWLDKAFATADPEAMTSAALRMNDWVRRPESLEKLRMTKEEMEAKALAALQAGRKEKVPAAYPLLAERLRNGNGIDKNEGESAVLMAEFDKLVRQKIARGSMGARILLMQELSMSGAADANEEVLRLATEILEKSTYPGHYGTAALLGARSMEKMAPDQSEGMRSALAWLKDRQAEKKNDEIAGLIENYETRLGRAAPNASTE